MFSVILVVVLIFFLQKYFSTKYEFWKKHGVPNPPVTLFFGNLIDTFLFRKSLGQLYSQIYNDYPNLKYVGFYKLGKPAIVLRDPELIKDVLIKNFNSFHDTGFYLDEKDDPIFSQNPFALQREKWKIVRNKLSPCFTIKKIKTMFDLMNEVGKKAIEYINDLNRQEFDAKELTVKYTTDVTARCLFGIEGHSFVKGREELLKMGLETTQASVIRLLQGFAKYIFPFLGNRFTLKVIINELANYFHVVIGKSLAYKKENGITRGDLLDIMNTFRSKFGDDYFTDSDIVAFIGSIFIDAFDTTSIALSFLLFDLAVNTQAQNRLRTDIDNLIKNHGEFTYANITELEYLDAVCKESLRLHPPLPFLSRVCTESFKLPSPYYDNKNSYVDLKPGITLFTPSYAINRDSTHYKNPDQFLPERYCGQSQDIPSLSFGAGPRYCLGEKYSNIVIKTLIARIIANFEVHLNTKTILPLEIDPQSFMLKPKGGIWVNLRRRNKCLSFDE